jgi:hypothetical protein
MRFTVDTISYLRNATRKMTRAIASTLNLYIICYKQLLVMTPYEALYGRKC